MRAKAIDQREQRVARQIEVLLAQEESLDKRRDELREREDRVVRSERELGERRRVQEFELGKRSAALDERARELDEREQALADRERALDGAVRKKARDLAQEAVSLAERSGDVSRREVELSVQARAEPSGVRPPDTAPPAASIEDTAEIPLPPEPREAPEARVPAGGWNLDSLERLVEQHGRAFPARLDEWRYYLLYLREFADARGNLPRPFDWLVYTEFEELLDQTPTAMSVSGT